MMINEIPIFKPLGETQKESASKQTILEFIIEIYDRFKNKVDCTETRQQIENCISDSLKAQFIAHEFKITEGQRNVLTNEIIEQFWALSYPIHVTLPSITNMNLQMTFQQLKEHFNKRIENLKVELKLTE